MSDTITPYQAVKRMKELTELGIPFSFSFCSLNTTTGKSSGIKTVAVAQLRKSLRDNQSELSHQLITYIDVNQSDADRQFHLPLLLKFNEYSIKP
jgi:hypothetical protein